MTGAAMTGAAMTSMATPGMAIAKSARGVSMSLEKRVLHLALAGGFTEPLTLLLHDVLTSSGLRYELTPAGVCDVAIVMVSWGEELHEIAAARALAGAAPLLAILPFDDEVMARRVVNLGAQGWFTLDAPLPQLLAVLVRLAGLPVADGSGAQHSRP
jgi:hypothetical protein